MSYKGKYVTFKFIDGSTLSGTVVDTIEQVTNFGSLNGSLWFVLDTGWTVSAEHVAAAHWGNA